MDEGGFGRKNLLISDEVFNTGVNFWNHGRRKEEVKKWVAGSSSVESWRGG